MAAQHRHRRLILIVALLATAAVGSLPLLSGGETRSLLLARNSLLLAAGVCALAVPWGTALAALLVRTDVPGRKLSLLLVAAMLFVPLYLQAAAWQAGLGLGGWYSWAADAVTGEPLLSGWRGAIWIHSLAALPWVTVIVGLGLAAVPAEWEELALLDANGRQVFRHVTLRRTWAAMGIASLWVLVATAGEMTVTDMFQIRTYAEELYTGFALGDDLYAAPLGVLPGMIIVAWLTMAALTICLSVLPPQELTDMRPRPVFRLGTWRWPAALFTAATLVVLAFVPLANLVYQAGMASGLPGGAGQPTWSLGHFLRIVADSPRKHAPEFGWTIATGVLVAGAAVALAAPLAWLARRGGPRSVPMLAVIAVCLAVPGPLVGIGLSGALSQPGVPALVFLRDQTLFAPWAAQLVRSLPLATLIVWQALRTIPQETVEMAMVDGAGRGARLFSVALPQRRAALLGAWLVALAVAMGDVAATASDMVVPPGIDLLSRRIAGMLHASVYDEIAGICLTNAAMFVLIATPAIWLLSRPWSRGRN